MYQCNLSIFIVSDNVRLEAALKSAVVPEDCSVSVTTAAKLDEKHSSLDCAVIFDGTAAYDNGIKLTGEKALAVLACGADDIKSFGFSRKPDDLWLIPENADDDLLIFYAEKLIARMKESFDYRRQTICFNTAFDSIPDLVWFKDVKGAHLIVNNGFCDAVAKTKQQIYKQGHYYIWDIPKEEYDQGDYVCLESEEVVMNARETCLFDEKVKTKKGMRQFKTYKSPLIDENGEIFGTCGVANDVTAQHNINSELKVILDSMPFAVVIHDENENVIAANRLFYGYFPDYSDIVGTNLLAWKNSVLRGRLEDSEVLAETPEGMLILECRVKPIYSIFEEMIGNAVILSDVTVDRKRIAQNARVSGSDPLTGLANRKKLFEYADSIKYSPQITAVMTDLNGFKAVNTAFGHDWGDKALIKAADTIRSVFPEDTAARVGSDEFIVLINGALTADELSAACSELSEALKAAFAETEQFAGLSASIGAATSTSDGNAHSIEKLLKSADDAMLKAKSSGKNCVCIL